MIDFSKTEEIELDISNPFKHLIVAYDKNGDILSSKQVPACDSEQIFKDFLKEMWEIKKEK